MVIKTAYEHIVLDDVGVAWIDGTNIKVIEVVRDKLAHDSSAEEMHLQYPHLSIAQIYAALAYYHDHRGEFDRVITEEADELRRRLAEAGESPGRKRLRRLGRTA